MQWEKAGHMAETKVWAHRGASAYAPENTMEAFRLAAEMGADGVELDVQFSKDGELVVIHDETIDRVSNGTGWVKDYTLQELKEFSFNKLHPNYKRAVIPTLEEVLGLFKETEMVVNIELKTGVIFYEGIEDKVLELVKEMCMEEQVLYSSFNHYSVRKIKKGNPKARTGLLYADGFAVTPEYAWALQADALHPGLGNVMYPGFIKDCQNKGIRLHVWTVNKEWDIRMLREQGVDALITNDPDLALQCVKHET